MPSDRWRRIEAVYEAALAQDASARRAFLAQHCAGDDTQREEVESLLRHGNATQAFLDLPAAELPASAGVSGLSTLAAGYRIGSYEVIRSSWPAT